MRIKPLILSLLLLLCLPGTTQAQQTTITGVLRTPTRDPNPKGELWLYQSDAALTALDAIRIVTDSTGHVQNKDGTPFKVPRNSRIRVFSASNGLNSCRLFQPCSASPANGVWLNVPDVAEYTLEEMAAGQLQPATFGNPMIGLGDSIYGSTGGVATRLPGNTLAAKRWLRQTGT